MALDQKGKALAEYIWIDGTNGLRNKTKVSTLFSLSYLTQTPSSIFPQSIRLDVSLDSRIAGCGRRDPSLIENTITMTGYANRCPRPARLSSRRCAKGAVPRTSFRLHRHCAAIIHSVISTAGLADFSARRQRPTKNICRTDGLAAK